MGKSSLYANYLKEISSFGVTPIVIDCVADIGSQPNSLNWVRALGEAIETYNFLPPTSLTTSLDGLDDTVTAGNALRILLSEGLFHQIKEGRILLILDEYDYIHRFDYCDDIINGLRRIQNLQTDINYGNFNRLSVCLVGLRPVTRLGTPGEGNTSPLGLTLEVRDFESTDPTVIALLHEALPKCSTEVIERLLKLSGGQPFVTMEFANYLALTEGALSDVEKIADSLVRPPSQEGGISLFTSIDSALVGLGSDGFSPITAYRSLLDGSREAHAAPGWETLLLYGLIRYEGSERKVIKGELFRRCFNREWADRMSSRMAEYDSIKRQQRVSTTEQYRIRSLGQTARICVINTGGTLGMIQKGNSVVPPKDAEELKGYFQFLPDIAAEIDFINLFEPRDSINIFPNQWKSIAEYIYENRHRGFDGFVVAHGTDTLAFTASAVAFALGEHLSFPVVFTGAQTTPDVAYGDAHVNLYRACEVAKKNIPEVVICFNNHVFRAVRAQKKDDRRFDGFESPTYPPLAEIAVDVDVRKELFRTMPKTPGDITLRAEFERGILTVPQFPGLEPGFYERLLYNVNEAPQGIIIQTLGAGNVTSSEPYSFIPFVEQASERGIPVIVTSQHPPDPGSHTIYTPAKAPLKAGAIHAGNMTMAAAVTKFRWVLAIVKSESGWEDLSWEIKRGIISSRMVEESVVGEF